MRQWIIGIVAASLLSSLALTLSPAGRVKSVTRLVCGLVCALTVASPLFQLDIDTIAAGIAGYQRRAEEITAQAEDEEKMLERTYIEEKYAAYILAKATEAGASVTDAAVLARWDDEELVWYPWEATLYGTYSPELSRSIEADLGIPAQRQNWSDNG